MKSEVILLYRFLIFQSLTPRKLKTRSIHGSIPESPGGPNAIRISNFALIGSTTIRLADVEKNKFVLQKVRRCIVFTNFMKSVSVDSLLNKMMISCMDTDVTLQNKFSL